MPHGPRTFTGYLIRRAQQEHIAVWQRQVSTETSGPQFGVLSQLHASPGHSQAYLCHKLDLDRSTIADIVGRLEQRGLLTRSRHQDDRRRNVLSLTERGEDEYERLSPAVDVLDHLLTNRLSDDEAAELRRLLIAVIRHD